MTRKLNLTIAACLLGLVALLAGSVCHAQIWEEDFTHGSDADISDLGYTASGTFDNSPVRTDGSEGYLSGGTSGHLRTYSMDVPNVAIGTNTWVFSFQTTFYDNNNRDYLQLAALDTDGGKTQIHLGDKAAGLFVGGRAGGTEAPDAASFVNDSALNGGWNEFRLTITTASFGLDWRDLDTTGTSRDGNNVGTWQSVHSGVVWAGASAAYTIDSVYIRSADDHLEGPKLDDIVFTPDGFSPLPQTEFSWRNDVSGDWHTPSNWDPSGTPGAGTDIDNIQVTFGSVISQPQHVFTNEPVSVRDINFDSQHSYSIGGHGTVNLISGTNPQGVVHPRMTAAEGTHEFQARVSLNDDTAVDIASGATVEFNNRLFLNDNTLTKTGAGTIAFNNNVLTGSGTVICGEGACSGTGTIGGDLNNDGGTISPGNSGALLGDGSLAVVPEPSSLVILVLGLFGMASGYCHARGHRPART